MQSISIILILPNSNSLSAFCTTFEKINDYKIWRLIGKMKLNLSEPLSVVKEIKFKELRSLMKLNWHVDLQLVELVEKTLLELI